MSDPEAAVDPTRASHVCGRPLLNLATGPIAVWLPQQRAVSPAADRTKIPYGTFKSRTSRGETDAKEQRIAGRQFHRAEPLLGGRRDALLRLAGELLEPESPDGGAGVTALAHAGVPGEA
jgi:hypothetical protein